MCIARMLAAAGLLLGACATAARASENGLIEEPLGPEAVNLGGALPPPGAYFVNYTEFQFSTHFSTRQPLAHAVLRDYHYDVELDAPRLIGVAQLPAFTGNARLLFDVIQPVARVHATIGALGLRQSIGGVGDTIVDPAILGWHVGDFNLGTGLRVFVPDGNYDPKRAPQIGFGHPAIAFVNFASYAPPDHGPSLSAVTFVTRNYENTSTRYTSGTSFQADLYAGWNFSPAVSAGLSGYVFRQFTPDHGDGALYGGFAGSTFGFGPGVQMRLPFGQLSVQYQHDFVAVNRPRNDQLWFRLAIPLPI